MRFSVQVALVVVAVGLAWGTPAQPQKVSVLYKFGTNSGDPLNPGTPGVVAQGRDGSLYSTTIYGGDSGACPPSCGAVFKVTPEGKLTVLYNFDSIHGEYSFSGLTLGTDGNFYGSAVEGGTSNQGTIVKMRAGGRLTVLYDFMGASDGSAPYAPPVQATDGNFYGTASGQGSNFGTVYKITSSGKHTTLHQFNDTDGTFPQGPLVQGTDGFFYGTTRNGGNLKHAGVVFKISPEGKLTVLYTFDDTHGMDPCAGLIQGRDGNFYGTTAWGGSNVKGVVYKISRAGVFAVLHEFSKVDGANPYGGLLQATDGNFYGTTSAGGSMGYGTIYRISPQGNFSVIYNFDGTSGASASVTLLQHTNGILYGDAFGGGILSECRGFGCGTFFSLDLGLKPFVSLVSTSGKVGKTIGILGQGFKGTTGVSFNGTPATFKVISGTYLTAKVPSGATTGFVTVTTPGGKLKSNKKFRVR